MAGKENGNPPEGTTVETPAVETDKAPAAAAPVTTPATQPTDKQEESWAKKLGKGNARELLQEGLTAKATDNKTVKVEDVPATDDKEEGQPLAAAVTPAAPETDKEVETPEAKIARLEKERDEAAKKVQTYEQEQKHANAQALTQQQQNELRGRFNIIQGQRDLVTELTQEASEAHNDYGPGSPELTKVQNRLLVAQNSLNGSIYDYNQRLANFQQYQAASQVDEATKQINAALAEHGVTFEEIRKANPNADFNNVYTIMNAAVKLAASKKEEAAKAELAKEKAALAKEREDLKAERLKWGQSPGAQPDRGIAGGGNTGAGGQDVLSQIRSGKSSTELISAGLNSRKK